jgi:hypothetical protein
MMNSKLLTRKREGRRARVRKHEPCLADRAVEERFRRLARAWKKETWFHSSITQKSVHPAYQQIIGMGSPAVPLILRELTRKPDHWFWALTAITGEDPVPDSATGRLEEMTEAWLRWGREHGYVH